MWITSLARGEVVLSDSGSLRSCSIETDVERLSVRLNNMLPGGMNWNFSPRSLSWL